MTENKRTSPPTIRRSFLRGRQPPVGRTSPPSANSGARTVDDAGKRSSSKGGVGGDKYAPRLSSRTGGFEGQHTEVDSGIFSSSILGDEETVQMANTIQTIQTAPDTPETRSTMESPPKPRGFRSYSNATTAVAGNKTMQTIHNGAAAAAGGPGLSIFGKKRSSTASGAVLQQQQQQQQHQQNAAPSTRGSCTHVRLLLPKSPGGSSAPRSAGSSSGAVASSSNFSEAASRVLAESETPPSAKQNNSNRIHNNISNASPRFRLPDESQRIVQERRLKHPDSPNTFDQTDAAVVILSDKGETSDAKNRQTSTAASLIKVPPHTPTGRRSLQPATVVGASGSSEQGFELSLSGHVVQDKSRAKSIHSTPIDVDTLTPRRLDGDSPGALRLTEDGLKRHARKALRQSRLLDFKHLRRTSSLPEMHEADPSFDLDAECESTIIRRKKADCEGGKSKRRIKPFAASLLLRSNTKEDVTEFSLAPLNTMDDLHLRTTAAVHPQKHGRSHSWSSSSESGGIKKGVGIFFNFNKLPFLRKHDNSQAAVAILQRERQAALEAQRKQEFLEAQEQERRERKRREYLETQRSRELQAVSSAQRASIFAGMELVEQDRTVQSQKKKQQQNQHQPTDHHTQSTSSTTMTGAPPLFPCCVVCEERERTHVATPCMHLAYCQSCANVLRKEEKGCVVCARKKKVDATMNSKDVKFAAVSF